VTGRLHAWLAGRTERERRLLGGASVLGAALLGAAVMAGVVRDLATLRARVQARTLELAQVRRLAGSVPAGSPDDGGALLTRAQTATDEAGIAERVAAMTPADAGEAGPRLAVRLSGATLAEAVRLLHALDRDAGVGVTRLGLRKHPDDPRRFDATIELAGGGR
jgi:hypothetical protein